MVGEHDHHLPDFQSPFWSAYFYAANTLGLSYPEAIKFAFAESA